nr:rust resistance kinase lr10 [Quercus suber]
MNGRSNIRCPELRCREDGPAIRFPFRLKDRQPDHHCGYPGFDLYCSHNNDTVLELPTSVKVFVTFINYTHLFLEAAIDNCFPREIPGLNLSSSVFQKVNYPLEDSTLFNWPPETETDEGNPYRIDCLSNSSHSVYAFSSYDSIYHLPIVLCTKMYSVSVPYDIRLSFLGLTWSEPAECGSCEQKGKKCRFGNNSTDLKTECFDPNKDDKHKVSTLGSFLLSLVCYALYRIYRYDKIEKENQARIEIFLEDYRALKSTSSKGNGEEFINEVGTMGRIHHVNVVRLVGFCADGFRRALVYEFLPNDSLEKFISSVDSNCFLAKLCAKDQSAVSMTTARGTMDYIAPEVFSRNLGSVSYKSDVYSFGILLLEMVGGRKNVDVTMENTSQIYFPEWIYNLLEEKEDLRFYVGDNGDAEIAKKLAIVGLWCIQWHQVDRPSMKIVVQMLGGEGDKLTIPPNHFTSIGPTRINASMSVRRPNQELEVIPKSE